MAAAPPETSSAISGSPESKTVRTYKRLRIWPPILFLLILLIARIAPIVLGDTFPGLVAIVTIGPLVGMLGILLWWIFASRARLAERVVGILGLIAIGAATLSIADVSMRNPIVVLQYVLPFGIGAFGLGAVLFYRTSPRVRVIGTLLVTLIGWGTTDFYRFEGLWGDYRSSFVARWKPDAEQRYLEQLAQRSSDETSPAGASDDESLPILWSQFRGSNRDGVVTGLELDPNWSAKPPREVWRSAGGPSWSSFAVAGNRLITQEQRGESESIICLDADTGVEIWNYSYPSRFSESIGGAGPRATPTIAGKRLYALGATGMLHCLDLNGSVIWKKDLKQLANRQPPIWGFASSPLVTQGTVIVHAGGEKDQGIFGFGAEDGEVRWSLPAGDHSYSSPQLADLNGQTVVLMLTNSELSAIDAQRGKRLWKYEAEFGGRGVLQPLVIDSSIILSAGTEVGTRRIALAFKDDRPKITEDWASRDMKSDFNDFVAHNGCLYGFDGSIFGCIELQHGKRQWKKGRYGKGQVLLLADQGQLLVLSEMGDLALVSAEPKKFVELARVKILDGKTWNHPVVVGTRLYARNSEEIVCYELPAVNRSLAGKPEA